jgi:hypothetical protein
VIGGHSHTRVIPPVLDGNGNVKIPATEETILRGGTFQCTGDEAEACRADGGNKFQEI